MRDEADVSGRDVLDLSTASLGDIDAYGGSRLREAYSRLLSTEPDEPIAGFQSSLV